MDTNHVPPAENRHSSKGNRQACHTETRIKRSRTVKELDPMLTGTHFNRPECIIGSQYLDLYPVHVRMPTRIVTVEKNQVAWRAGLHLAEYTLILIFENSGRTGAR